MELTRQQLSRLNSYLKNNNIMNKKNQVIKVLDVWKNEDGFYCFEVLEKNETGEIFAEMHRGRNFFIEMRAIF